MRCCFFSFGDLGRRSVENRDRPSTHCQHATKWFSKQAAVPESCGLLTPLRQAPAQSQIGTHEVTFGWIKLESKSEISLNEVSKKTTQTERKLTRLYSKTVQTPGTPDLREEKRYTRSYDGKTNLRLLFTKETQEETHDLMETSISTQQRKPPLSLRTRQARSDWPAPALLFLDSAQSDLTHLAPSPTTKLVGSY